MTPSPAGVLRSPRRASAYDDGPAAAVRATAGAAGDWAGLRAAALGCTACPELAAGRTTVVFGQAPAGAHVALLGEAPGAEEDATGRPFVGRSGRLLDELLAGAGLSRDEVAVLNVLKCRPPGNRRPTTVEAARCRGWLDRQLALVDPAVVVVLGGTAAEWMLGPGTKVTAVRGRDHVVADRLVVPTFHPAAALRGGPAGQPRALLAADLAYAAGRASALRAGGVRFGVAGPADAAGLHDVTQAAYAENPPVSPPSGALAETVDDVRRDLTDRGGVVGRRAGRVVAGLRFGPPADAAYGAGAVDAADAAGAAYMAGAADAAYAWVRRVAVVPAEQRRGVGRGLMRWAHAVARTAGFGELRLGVRTGMPGNLAFYRALGYRAVGDHGHWTELAVTL